MKKTRIMYIIAAVMVIITATIFSVFSDNHVNRENIRFLNSLGIEVEKEVVEVQKVIIPSPFDRVYENYNELQIEGGFDLEPYAGMEGMRYTYIVTNYPEDVGEDVRANVICIQDKPVGGDVMTVSLDGFMKPLNCMKDKK